MVRRNRWKQSQVATSTLPRLLVPCLAQYICAGRLDFRRRLLARWQRAGTCKTAAPPLTNCQQNFGSRTAVGIFLGHFVSRKMCIFDDNSKAHEMSVVNVPRGRYKSPDREGSQIYVNTLVGADTVFWSQPSVHNVLSRGTSVRILDLGMIELGVSARALFPTIPYLVPTKTLVVTGMYPWMATAVRPICSLAQQFNRESHRWSPIQTSTAHRASLFDWFSLRFYNSQAILSR